MVRLLIVVALLCGPAAFGQNAEPPTTEEIAAAYRSKTGEGGLLFPGLRWERRRINKVRGWSLKFERLSQDRTISAMILRYRAVAKRNNTCAEYRITDRIPLPPPNPQIKLKPSLTVESSGVANCR